MDRLHEDVPIENRRFVDIYLLDPTILSINLVLQSTKLAEDYDHVAPELLSLTQAYAAEEEQRLQKNMENIDYDLDGPTTVTLVTGRGRIERVSVQRPSSLETIANVSDSICFLFSI
jgi:hypothetical protein